MNKKLIEVELTIKLQIELEKMTKKEFKQYMKGKVLVYEGKKYGFKKEDKQETASEVQRSIEHQ